MDNEIKIGSEVLVDGWRWAVVEEITSDSTFFVVDQDGAEMEVPASRIDPLN